MGIKSRVEIIEWLDKELKRNEVRSWQAVSRGDIEGLKNLEKHHEMLKTIRKDYDDEGNFTGRTD